MKRLLALLITAHLSLFTAFAQNYYTRAAGAWGDNATVWSTVSQSGAACSCNPGNTISGSNTVYIYNTITSFGALSSLSGSGKLVIESGDSAIITTSNFSVAGSASITINAGGTLILNGALSMSGSSSITINGKMFVYGNITNSGSAAVNDNGDLTVHGNVSTSGSASFSGSGTSYVVGTVSGPNTSMLSVLPQYLSNFANGSGTGIVQYQYNPSLNLTPLQFNNNTSSVLVGNGTWASFSSLNPWQVSGNNLYYTNGNIGIGTSNPNYPLTVQGNALISGTLFANNVAASSGLSIGSFRIVNGAVDTFNSATGTIFVNAATINAANGITAQQITTGRIKELPGDSLIHFGDSSIIMDIVKYNIYSEVPGFCLSCPNRYYGIALGSNNYVNTHTPSNSGTTAVVIGNSNHIDDADFQTAIMGYNNTITGAGNAMIIGTGLTNNISGSIMIGNSINNKPAITIIQDPTGNTSGNIGIGTKTPTTALEVNGNITADADGSLANTWTQSHWKTPLLFPNGSAMRTNSTGTQGKYLGFGMTDDGSTGWYWMAQNDNNTNDQAFYPMSLTLDATKLDANNNPYPTLDVFGLVRAQEVRVCTTNTCDFVFDKNYSLMPLEQLEAYLDLNHHLPVIASAKEMEAEGTISLGKMNMQLLQKVEELTLYTIQLKKQVDDMQQMKVELAELKAVLSKLQQNNK